MLIFLKKFFVFRNYEVNTVFYLVLAFAMVTLAYDYAYIKFEKIDSALTMLYYNVVTASTVGYGDFSPQTFEGKVLTVIYIPIAISLFAAMLSVVGAIMYGNITKRQRGLRKVNSRLDFLIIGGYKTKTMALALNLSKEGKRVAILNDLYETIPYEYKKEGILWVKGGHQELDMFNHDKIEQYIALSDDPTQRKSDITNNFVIEKITEHTAGEGRIIVEVEDKDKHDSHENLRFMNYTKASLIAREALVPDSMAALEDILDNGKDANQVNIILKAPMSVWNISRNLCEHISNRTCRPIGYLEGETWKYIDPKDADMDETPLEEGTKVKLLIEGEIGGSFANEKKKDTILILGQDAERVKRLIRNYLLDSRFSESEFSTNLDIEGTQKYDISEGNESNKLHFNKIVILSNLFNKGSDETNFYLWGRLRKKVDGDVRIITEMTDEKNRNTLEKSHKDAYNEFITYSNTGLIVQELQDSGFIRYLEEDTAKHIDNINYILGGGKK